MAIKKKATIRSVDIPQRYREGEKLPLDSRWRTHFLDRLAETSNVSEAARSVGVNTAHVYKLRRLDPEFALQWRASLLEGYEHLELETIRRLREGVPADGPKFDIPAALRLLALHAETVAKERTRLDHSDEASVLARLNERLDAMRRNERAFKETLREEAEAARAKQEAGPAREK